MISFNEEIFPYGILEGMGLTREMIDDLPEHVLETIDNGGRSPMLQIEIPTKFGSISLNAKFRVTDNILEDGKRGLILYPQLIESDLGKFSETEKNLLLSGMTILADMQFPDKAGNDSHKEKCFVQIDKDTNHVFYVHASVIGRNLRVLDSIVDLSDEDFNKLSKGGLVTITDPEFMTIGINLFSENGITICFGGEENWRILNNKHLERYNFGLYGCWVNENGILHYVKEKDFDEPILSALSQINASREYYENSKVLNPRGGSPRESFNNDEGHQMTR